MLEAQKRFEPFFNRETVGKEYRVRGMIGTRQNLTGSSTPWGTTRKTFPT